MRGLSLFSIFLAAGVTTAGDSLPPGAVLRLGETRFRASGEVRHLRFSPDGTILLGWASGVDGQLQPAAWETATGLPVPPLGVYSLPDVPERATPAARLTGDRVVTAGPGCAGRVWDATTGRQLALLAGHSAVVTAVAVSRDGKQIATGSADGLIKLWDADSFHPLSALGGHTGPVRTIRLAANSMRAVTRGEDGSARVWDLKTGKELRGFCTKEPVELTSDGTGVVMSVGGQIIVRDILTGLEVVPAHQPPCPTHTISELLSQFGLSIAFSPDGRTVSVARQNGTIGLYETATGQERRKLVGHRSVCSVMAFTPDGSHLLTAGTDHSVLVWAVRVQDLPMPVSIQQETRAGKLWTMLTTGRADAAYLAMARFAAEPPAAVKMARMRLRPAEETDSDDKLADTRGVELLESLRTSEARELLEKLASGDPSAHRTHEAKLALERLGGKW